MSWSARSAVIGLILLSMTVVVLLVSFLFGGVRGEEFNPYSFTRRKFYFYEIPLLRVQIWPLVRSNASGDAETLIQDNKYVQAPANAPDEWHLFTFNRSAAPSPPFDAAILKTYLDAKDENGKSFWSEWSERHADRAKYLWPHVARFARLKLYVVLPHLFEIARTTDDATELETALKQESLRWLIEYGKRRQSRGDHESAVRLFQQALEIDPEHADTQKLLRESEQAQAAPADATS